MPNFQSRDLTEFFITVVLVLGFWIIITLPGNPFSGLGPRNLVQHLILGLFLANLVAVISPYPILTKQEISFYLHAGIIFRFIIYIGYLCLDIIKAGIDVAKRVLRPNILISPGIVEVDTPLKDDIQIALNANSITLTPGTITIDAYKTAEGSRFLIHCISRDAVEDIIKNRGFVKRIQECFKVDREC